ncbi:DoxX family protein [Brevibacillus choshinensis]|uniref:DoxX family protein n=1 Tax=Brevibacillus choshinensis TaxID=54911 RepID=UPI002E1B46B0|nr:DoxX family protein [Brevibacillus choshinensis]
MRDTMSKGKLWTARIMSGLVILFMLLDSIMKFVKPAPVVEGTLELGYSEHHIVVIGALGLLSTLFYLIPRTTFFGAVLLTGYFGGVIATHIRMDAPLFTHTLFPVYLAVLMWGGIWLRHEKVRKLVPFAKSEG